jgi:hypothetical protein
MSIKVGTTDIATVGKIKLGTTNITKVFRGTTQIWPLAELYSFVAAGISSGSGSGACGINFDPALNITLYSESEIPWTSDIMYSNNSLSTPFNGGSQWYRIGGDMDGYSYQINNSGVIIATYDCMF